MPDSPLPEPEPESPIAAAPRGHLLLILAIAYVFVRLGILWGVAPILHPDSKTYLRVFESGFSGGLLGNERAFGYPLVLAAMGHSASATVWLQKLVAIGCWLLFASGLSGLFADRRTSVVSFILVLAVSLDLNLLHWDVSILTESLTISLFAGTCGCWMLSSGGTRRDRWWILPTAALAAVCSTLRDANHLLVPAFGLLLAIRLAFWWRTDRSAQSPDPIRTILVPVLALAILLPVFLMNRRDLSTSDRGWKNAANVASIRALIEYAGDVNGQPQYRFHDAHRNWFQEHGMPAEAIQRAGRHVYAEPKLSPELKTWYSAHMRNLWRDFLFAHPGWAISTVLDSTSVYAGSGEIYLGMTPDEQKANWGRNRLTGPRIVEWTTRANPARRNLPYIHEILVLAALGCFLGWIWAGWRGANCGKYFAALTPMLAMAAVMPFVALLGDAIENWRHALLGLAALEMAIVVLLSMGAAQIRIRAKSYSLRYQEKENQ